MSNSSGDADALIHILYLDDAEGLALLMQKNLRRRGFSVEWAESGAAGLAGLIVLSKDEELRAAVGLDASSRVLLINTETATDPSSYEEIVGTAPSAIGRAA